LPLQADGFKMHVVGYFFTFGSGRRKEKISRTVAEPKHNRDAQYWELLMLARVLRLNEAS
jgi:hypothetical protein